ncbi:endolysin [Klebsiella phage pKMKP103]|uniref:Cell wall hydrolyse n=2 Tax=Sugarlandvirus TaxID=2560233 RepID=A0A976SW71_9CAUD|nr:hypothetical protein JIPhKp127_0104 [Klebsiella phage JIPh_Kp127]UVD42230.1 cell wall hydrolyse [Klebsiella phage GZ8]UVX81974.1 MAG: cell wall hydrolase [Bacteriophage sp.]WKW87740.1 hypothetical protein pzkkv7_49 [Klebsiella phage pzk-kv7]WKW88439.1 hypothetical protein pzkkv23_13 [Klebsiella phage pzk-kv23]WOZ53614.1 endolysin [Klebsiella phage pKMKP103]
MKAAILMISILTSFHAQAKIDAHEIECIAKNAYFEAKGEGVKGMTAVAQVTKNRVNYGKFPSTYCKVVYQPGQFSWVGKKKHKLDRKDEEWKQAKEIARLVYYMDLPVDPTKGALYFHSKDTKPYWTKDKDFKRTSKIGNHVFYKLKSQLPNA